MHELYATQAILEKAIQKANEAEAKRITNLYLVVGEISTYTMTRCSFIGTISAKEHWRKVRSCTFVLCKPKRSA